MKRILVLAVALIAPCIALAESGQDRNNQNSQNRNAQDQRDDSTRASMKQDSKAQREANDTIRNAARVYDEMVLRSPKGAVPVSVQSHAKCIAIFPNTITAGVVLGGTHGNGVVSCKNGGTWSTPALADLTGASLGLQAGGKSTDLVLFVNSDSAVSSLKKGKFNVGADASIAVGSYDAAVDTSSAGVVAYQRNEGGYIGASLTSGSISLDEDSNRALYGSDMVAIKLLDGIQTGKTTESQELTSKFPA
jgi:lipid-binding SYLF domain-containing protein